MKKKKHVLALFFCLAVIGLLIGGNGYGQPTPLPKIFKSVPSGYSSEEIEVKFREGTVVDDPEVLLPPDLLASVKRISPLFPVPKERLKELRAKGEKRSKKKLPDLTLWFMVSLKSGGILWNSWERLRGLDNVEIVEPAPLPAPLPATTPNFTGNGKYLVLHLEASSRILWTVPRGNGTGTTTMTWNTAGIRTTKTSVRFHGIPPSLNPGEFAVNPDPADIDTDHGTAVLGEVIADNDAKGVTGIAWGADIGLAPANTNLLGYDPANAILLAVADGTPGRRNPD